MKSIFKDSAAIFIALALIVGFTNLFPNVVEILIFFVAAIIVINKIGILAFRTLGLKLLLVSYLITLIYSFFGFGFVNSSTFKGWIFNSIIVFSIYIISNYIYRLNIKQMKALLVVSLLALLFSAFTTLKVGLENPMALRTFGFGDIASESQLESIRGMITYGQAHALAEVSAGLALIICFIKSRFMRIMAIVLLVTIIVFQFLMTITTAMLVSVSCAGLIMLCKLSKGKTSLMIIYSAVFLLIILSSNFFLYFLDFADSTNSEIFAKLNDLYTSVTSGSSHGQMDAREGLYSTSIDSFLSSPILGGAIDDGSRRYIGQHSYFFDSLAFYGIFGIIYFFSWWTQYRSLIKSKNRVFKISKYICFLPVLILTISKAQSVCLSLPFVSLIFIPLLFNYINAINIPALTQGIKTSNGR